MKKHLFLLLALVCLSSLSFCEEKKLASGYINEGINNYDSGNYIEAILNLRSAEQLSPNPVTVYKYLGMSYSKLSLWPQAEKEFNEIIYVNPADPDRAVIIAKINEWEKLPLVAPAMAQFSFYSIKYKNRIFKDPENLLNYLALTEIYKCSGRYDEAENFFRALVKDRPDKPVFKKYLAEVLFLNKKYGEAGSLYKRILDDDPSNIDAIISYNIVLKKRYDDIIAKNPDDTVTYLKLARVLRDLKRYEDSLNAYEAYLSRDNANTDVRREMNETKKLMEAVVPKEGFKIPIL